MISNIVVLSCTLVFVIQNCHCECLLRNSYNVGSCGAGLTYNEYPLPLPWRSGTCNGRTEYGVVAASDGGGFAVQSASSLPPSGVSVLSENEYAGTLSVVGQLPFLGTTYLEGAVPSAGVGAVTYGCGYGDVRILSEDIGGTSTGLGHINGIVAPWSSNIGYNGGRGCSCGLL